MAQSSETKCFLHPDFDLCNREKMDRKITSDPADSCFRLSRLQRYA